MDRRQLLDRAARNGDERVLLAHILDKCEQSRNRNIPSATDFLSPAEQRSAQDLLHAAAIHDGCAFCGGFERAERRMLLFLPDWQEEADESEYMTALRCTYRKEDTLTHRDFLGSLMAQGVTREKLGDILVSEGSCDLIVSRDIAPYLLQNVTSAGRVKLSVSEIELSDLSVPALKVKEIRDTVSTLRLDAVAASGFSMSRGKAQELISSGRVQLNHRETLKSDAPVAQGDVISARGLGKFEVAEVGGLSKKEERRCFCADTCKENQTMTMDEKIARINALAHKAKAEGLTDEEKEEQAQLRRDYIDSVKANLKSQLNTLYVLDEKTGKKTKIVDFERERAARAGKKKENR